MVEQGRIKASDYLCPADGNAWVLSKDDPLLGRLFTIAARKETTVQSAPPVNGNKGTVVQVTNNIAATNPIHAALLLDPGPAKPKSPGVALLLSILIPGLGQMYNGEVGKGFAMFLGTALLWVVHLWWIVCLWSWIDAYSTAKKMNLRYQRRMVAAEELLR
jgi:hypothetical protein